MNFFRLNRGWARLCACLLVLFPVEAAAEILLVHLPSAPIESSTRLANAVTSLGTHLSNSVPGLELEVKIFRRREDAKTFLEANASSVVALLSDTSFLLDLPADEGLIPAWRFRRSGSETYRRLLVVRSEDAELRELADLRARSLQVVETTGSQSSAFLERAVFRGELVLADWFGSLEAVADDFTAVANLLHGKTQVALVAAHNPLLRSKLGEEIRVVYTSPPLSLPVLALRVTSLESDQQASLGEALAQMGESAEGQRVLEDLHLDGFRPVATGRGPFDREALLRLPSLERKPMEIALPSSSTVSPELVPPVAPQDVTFGLTIELPEIEEPEPRRPAAQP